LQDSNHACLTKEARAQNNLACPIKEAKALNVKGINSKNTIIVHILEGSPVKGKSRTICINFINYKKVTDKIKAKKANRAKLRD
jgi:hypothetical protein